MLLSFLFFSNEKKNNIDEPLARRLQHIYKWQDPVMATSVGTAQSKGQRLIQQKTINGVL